MYLTLRAMVPFALLDLQIKNSCELGFTYKKIMWRTRRKKD
jgi:hypothetical protein